MDIKDINLNLLVHFRTLMEELSVSKAALRTRLTQPAMSHILADLRRVFDDPLFVRGTEGLVPTMAAIELEKQLVPLLKKLDVTLANQSPFNPQTSRRRFVITTNDYLSLIVMPGLLKRVSEEAPHVQIEVIELSNSKMADLGDRSVDLMLTYHLQKELKVPFYEEALFRDELCLVVRDGHPDIKDSVTIEQLSMSTQIIVRKSSGALGTIVTHMEAIGTKPRICFVTPHYLVSAFVLSESDMIYLTSVREYELYQELNLGLKSVPCPFETPKDTIKLIWHENASQDKGNRWLRQKFREVCQDI